MISIPKDLDRRIKKALQNFWLTRDQQIERQHDSNVHDQGNRGAATGGKQLDGFITLVRDIFDIK